jgi:UDP-glucose 4-epimerase
MPNKKIALITGAAGYLGSHMAKSLKRNGWYVIGIDIKKISNHYIDYALCFDINDEEVLRHCFEKFEIDTVFHFAGRIEVGESIIVPTLFYQNNVSGTITLLNVMKIHGVNKILYSSTAGLYSSKNRPLREYDELNPLNNPYAGSKYCAELAIQQSGVKYVIFRYFNLAGADEELEFGEDHVPETHLIPKILQNLNNVQIYGDDYDTHDGTCVRDYVHISDVVDAHLAAAEYIETNPSITLNLGTGKGYSVKEIVNLVENIVGKLSFTILPKRPGDPSSLTADINLAQKVLHYRPKRDIIDILQTTYEWEKNRDRKEY